MATQFIVTAAEDELLDYTGFDRCMGSALRVKLCGGCDTRYDDRATASQFRWTQSGIKSHGRSELSAF